MKALIPALIVTFVLGWLAAGSAGHQRAANEYSRGYHDGFYAPHAVALHPVVENLLCKYAELACGKPKHDPAH